jgi:hypothetical protein
MISSSSPTRKHKYKHNAILNMIELNLTRETDFGIFQNAKNVRRVSDAPVSPQQRKKGTVSAGKQHSAPNSPVLPRRSKLVRRAASFGIFQNVNNTSSVSDAAVSPQQRKRGTISAGKYSAPNGPMLPRKSMLGRRATSSTTLSAGSIKGGIGAGSGKGRGRQAFQRQFSLRGWRENDNTGHDGSLEKITGTKMTRLNDYRERPLIGAL